MDILFLDDEKIELANSTVGDVAIAILTKTWAKLAQMDKANYSYPANWKMLKLAIKSTSSVKTIERVIRGFGLFAFEWDGDSERFYSPRLRDHFTDLDTKVGGGREISDEARAKMREGGRSGKGGGRPKKQGKNKVDDTENKVENKVQEEKNKVDDAHLVFEDPKKQGKNKVDDTENKVENKVQEEKNKVDDAHLVFEDPKKQGKNKVDDEKKQGNGGIIGGLNAPSKEESLKSKAPKGDIGGAKSVARFCPPTLEEVQSYVLEKGIEIDAERFVAYYDSNGWMVGRNKMKSWKSAIITWKKNEEKYDQPQRAIYHPPQQRILPSQRIEKDVDRTPEPPSEKALEALRYLNEIENNNGRSSSETS